MISLSCSRYTSRPKFIPISPFDLPLLALTVLNLPKLSGKVVGEFRVQDL